MKRVALLALGLGLLLTLGGCSLYTPEQMYTLPKPPAEYEKLNTCIQQTMAALGAEYTAPLAGDNAQTVQLVDLDKDGENEAVAFFRVTGDAKPLKVYVFKRDGEESYRTWAVIEGEGTAIYSISYEDLGGDDADEIVVSWRMSEKVHALAAYSIGENAVQEWMRTGYSGYRLLDIDMDNQKEILVLQLDVAEGTSRVELYDAGAGSMVLCAAAPMSSGVSELTAVNTGLLRDSVPALFVSSSFGEGSGVLTDIFAWRGGTLENITLAPRGGQSLSTVRYYDLVGLTDINGDSVLEVPMPEALPTYQKTVGAPAAADFWMIHWLQFDVSGQAGRVCSTYHNVQDRWYLVLPDAWRGNLTLSRRENTVYGERAVVFSRWLGEESEPEPFLILYRLTDNNREQRAQLGERFLLASQSDAVYAAEFVDSRWDCGLTREELTQRFRLIRTEWSDDD